MANIDKIIPFFIHWESGLPERYQIYSPEHQFEAARTRAFADDPDDAGGATLCGVTIDTYRRYRLNVKGIRYTSVYDLKRMPYADWKDILRRYYWNRWQADGIQNESFALILVDWVWGSGKYGITIPQRLLGITVDGIVGPQTLSALNKRLNEAFFNEIKKARKDYFEQICIRRPQNRKFLRGWMRRLDAINFEP
jgi:lysozyme family protein